MESRRSRSRKEVLLNGLEYLELYSSSSQIEILRMRHWKELPQIGFSKMISISFQFLANDKVSSPRELLLLASSIADKIKSWWVSISSMLVDHFWVPECTYTTETGNSITSHDTLREMYRQHSLAPSWRYWFRSMKSHHDDHFDQSFSNWNKLE